jgi:hypothetical protein
MVIRQLQNAALTSEPEFVIANNAMISIKKLRVTFGGAF